MVELQIFQLGPRLGRIQLKTKTNKRLPLVLKEVDLHFINGPLKERLFIFRYVEFQLKQEKNLDNFFRVFSLKLI